MFDDSESEARLGRLFAAPKAARAANARELEGRLLDAFDQRYPRKEHYRMKRLTVRRALILCAAAGVLGVVACAAPVDLDVEVGRTIAIRYDDQVAGSPEPKALAEFLRTAAASDAEEAGAQKARGVHQIELRMRKEPHAVAIDAEIWGSAPPSGSLAARVKEAFPALAGAQIKEELLHGKVRGTLAKKLGRDMLDLDLLNSADVETARKQVMEQLRAQGIDGKVDVQIEGGSGERKVMIRVEKDCPDGGAGEVPPELP